MAAPAKSVTSLASAQSVSVTTAADSTSTFTATTSFGYGVSGTVTNGATVTTATIVQLMGSGDNATFYVIDSFPTQTGNGTVTTFAFQLIPDGYSYFKLHYTASAGAGFTVTAVIVYCTGFA